MKPKDPDTFVDIGVSITRLLLIASGQGMAAGLIGEGAGLLKNLRSGGQRAVSAEKIADDVADQLFREHEGISEADWHVAAANVAPLIDRLSEKDRLAAGYDWEALRPVLRDLGSEERQCALADESARQAFDWVLDVACQRIADLFTEKEALASLLKKVNEDCARLQRIERLLDRPGVQETSVVINDHIEVLRDLAPDRLEDRESEMADLKAFVHSSDDVWYAMEADMVSGKTAVMVSFALDSPDDVHMVSFFIRRIGGDGNDRGSFAFVMGAQLAKILGHEYTEPVRDPAQHTEFRQLLRRAATACRSEATPRPLVLLIDGIDEDSYFENPDGADAKSILSLLPSRLPEGVKIITASRPNPRLPEDVLCDANTNRRIVSLKPSPIAEKSINRKDIAKFFKSDVAVDIGAFLAACGGVLTVQDLSRLLTTHRHQRTRTWDVREYVDRSPGRILTPVDVGFGGQEVLAYRLGHDVVERAVILELDPNSFGEGDEPEDERWWAPIRQKALAPYRAIIRKWVKECASRGWGPSTPSYVLSGACFDLVFNDKTDDGSSVRVVLDRGRYDEMRRRSGRRSHVLRMIDRECLKTLSVNRGELPEDTVTPLLDIAESRGLLARMSAYVPGLLKLHALYLNPTPEAMLDMILAIDDPRDRVNAIKEMVGAVMRADRNYTHTFLPFLRAAMDSLATHQRLRWDILHFLMEVLMVVYGVDNGFGNSDNENLKSLLDVFFASLKIEKGVLQVRSSFKNIDGRDGGDYVVSSFIVATRGVVEKIEDPYTCAEVLTNVASMLVRVGKIDDALELIGQIEDRWIRAEGLADIAGALARMSKIDDALELIGQIEYPRVRAEGLADIAGALARMKKTSEALWIIRNAMRAVEQIKELWGRGRALAGVADALARAGEIDRALAVIKRIEDPEERGGALVGVADVLARAGEIDRALAVIKRIENPRVRGGALTGIADVLTGSGEADDVMAGSDKINDEQWVAESVLRRDGDIEYRWTRAKTLSDVIGTLVGVGQIDRALDVIKRIEYRWERAKALVDVADALAETKTIDELLRVTKIVDYPELQGQVQSAVIKALVGKGSSDEAVDMLRAALAEVEGFVRRQDAADYCAVLAATCLDAADLVDAGTTTHEQWLGLARSALARSWLYGASVWDRFDVLLRVAPDLATRLVEERLLAEPEPESASPTSSVDPASPEEPEGPESPGGGTPSSR